MANCGRGLRMITVHTRRKIILPGVRVVRRNVCGRRFTREDQLGCANYKVHPIVSSPEVSVSENTLDSWSSSWSISSSY